VLGDDPACVRTPTHRVGVRTGVTLSDRRRVALS